MFNLVSKYQNNNFIRAVFNLSSATALGQVIALAVVPVLSRLYSPNDFGILATFTGISVTLLVVSSLRYEFAIPIQNGENNAKRLIIASLAINALVALATIPVLFLFGAKASTYLEVPSLELYLWLIPLFLLFAGGYRVYVNAAIRNQDYRLVSRTKVSQALSCGLFQIFGGMLRIGAGGLITGFILSQCVGLIVLIRRIGTPFKLSGSMVGVHRTTALLLKNKRFPIIDMPAAAADTLGSNLPGLLLVGLFNPAVAGFYAISYRLLSAPVMLVGQAAGQVLLGSARTFCQDASIAQRLKKAILSLTAFVLVFAALSFVFIEPLFILLLGEQWHEAAIYAKWIAVGLSAQLVYSPISVLLLATNGQHLNLKTHLLLLLCKGGAIWFGFTINSSLFAVIGVSLVNALGYTAAIIWLYRHVVAYSVSSNKIRLPQ